MCTVTLRVRATAFGTKETFRLSRVYIFVDGGRGCITSKSIYNARKSYIYICMCVFILYNILLCVSCPRRKRFFGARACVRCGFFTRRRKCSPYTGLYIYMYTIFYVVCGQKITPTVIYCRRDTYYSLLQADRVRAGGLVGALYTHFHSIRGRRGRFSFLFILILFSRPC